MSKKEIVIIIFLIFMSGFFTSQLFAYDFSVSKSIPFLALIGAFLGVIFNRIQHIDDLNLSRKKDVSLEYIKFISEYRSVLISITDHSISPHEFHKNLIAATRNMIGALDKFHVVSDDEISSKIELKNFEISTLMVKMNQKLHEYGDDKVAILKWLISEDILKQLNEIRYQIINLISAEIGDKSGTSKLKSAIEKNNDDFKDLLLKVLS